MNLHQVLRDALQQLAAAQVPSASTTAEVLLMHVLERDRTFLYAYPEAELSVEQERAYRHLLRQRAAGHPTQYLTCRQEFWGLPLHVEPGVFIPRPETEHVVEVALQIVRERMSKADARIVDVGTGTGCIALALAKELPEAHITAVDVSEDALRLAGHNAEALSLASRVQLLPSDLLDVFTSHESRVMSDESRPFDLIVSNPPYVSPDQAGQLPREVREHEPPAALFSPGDGLEVTRRLVEQAQVLLVPGGALVLELGYNMAARARSLMGDAWTNIEITNDLRGIPRVLAAQRK